MYYNRVIERHISNIKRQVGNDGNGRYSFIVKHNDLIDNYLQMRDELGYPLMIDSRNRRAIVYNKKGLEKKIEQLVNKCITDNMKILENIVTEDIVNNVVNKLSAITLSANGKININNKSKTNMSSMLGSAIGKGLVDGIGKIIDDMTDIESGRKR